MRISHAQRFCFVLFFVSQFFLKLAILLFIFVRRTNVAMDRNVE